MKLVRNFRNILVRRKKAFASLDESRPGRGFEKISSITGPEQSGHGWHDKNRVGIFRDNCATLAGLTMKSVIPAAVFTLSTGIGLFTQTNNDQEQRYAKNKLYIGESKILVRPHFDKLGQICLAELISNRDHKDKDVVFNPIRIGYFRRRLRTLASKHVSLPG